MMILIPSSSKIMSCIIQVPTWLMIQIQIQISLPTISSCSPCQELLSLDYSISTMSYIYCLLYLATGTDGLTLRDLSMGIFRLCLSKAALKFSNLVKSLLAIFILHWTMSGWDGQGWKCTYSLFYESA